MRTVVFILAIMNWCIFAESQPLLRVEVTLRGNVVCRYGQSILLGHEPLQAEIPVKIYLKNISKHKVAVGKITLINERLYRGYANDKLSLIRTTPVPDEFGTSFLPGDGFPDIVDEEFSAGAEKFIEVKEYLYIVPGDVQTRLNKRVLLVSFHVTNLLHNGDGNEYWTDPMSIGLPESCDPRE
jgi:hypothetical protein